MPCPRIIRSTLNTNAGSRSSVIRTSDERRRRFARSPLHCFTNYTLYILPSNTFTFFTRIPYLYSFVHIYLNISLCLLSLLLSLYGDDLTIRQRCHNSSSSKSVNPGISKLSIDRSFSEKKRKKESFLLHTRINTQKKKKT